LEDKNWKELASFKKVKKFPRKNTKMGRNNEEKSLGWS